MVSDMNSLTFDRHKEEGGEGGGLKRPRYSHSGASVGKRIAGEKGKGEDFLSPPLPPST